MIVRLSIATGIPYRDLADLDDALLTAYLEELSSGDGK